MEQFCSLTAPDGVERCLPVSQSWARYETPSAPAEPRKNARARAKAGTWQVNAIVKKRVVGGLKGIHKR